MALSKISSDIRSQQAGQTESLSKLATDKELIGLFPALQAESVPLAGKPWVRSPGSYPAPLLVNHIINKVRDPYDNQLNKV